MSETDMAKIARLVADPHAEAIAAKDGEIEQAQHATAIAELNYGRACATVASLEKEIAALRSALKAAKPIVQNFYDGNEEAYELICNCLDRAALEMSGGVKS